MNKKLALLEIDKRKDAFTALSDRIWDMAEKVYHEYRSAELLCSALEDEGFEVIRGIAGISTAFVGKSGTGKPVIGVLGEFDALPGLSQEADSDEKSQSKAGGNSHSCGHNLLGVGSFAAVVAVKEFLKQTHSPGTVIYYGCPAEEGGSGKTFMAKAGSFNELDCAFTWHPCDFNGISTGSTLANIQKLYRFYGVSAHAAASPHFGRSALDALELMNIGTNFLREHIISEARVHYSITNAGGMSPSVVQPFAEGLYLVRAPEIEQAREICDRIDNIAKGAALMTDTRMQSIFIKACSNIVPNRFLEELLFNNMETVSLPDYTHEEWCYAETVKQSIPPALSGVEGLLNRVEKSKREFILSKKDKAIRNFIVPHCFSEKAQPGSSDVGDVSWICPTAQILAASWVAGTQAHTWQAASQGKGSLAHKSILYSGKVIASAIIDLIISPNLIREAKDEHTKQLGGRKYRTPIPDGINPQEESY